MLLPLWLQGGSCGKTGIPASPPRKERECPLRKKFYIASVAQAQYETELRLSRTGVRPDEDTVRKMDEVLSPCIRRGQSPMAVKMANPGLFGKFARSTVYGWINGGLFHAKRHDQPFACSRRAKPKKAQETKADARCRVGRSVREMWEWLKEHAGVVACELDTVVGSISGKILYTMIFPGGSCSTEFKETSRMFKEVQGRSRHSTPEKPRSPLEQS